MERNTLIAVVLSVAVIIAWQVFVEGPKNAQIREAQMEAGRIEKEAELEPVEQEPPSAATNEPATAEKPFKDTIAPNVPEDSGETPLSALDAREITVDTNLYRAVISSKGGVIKSWELKKYRDEDDMPLPLLKDSMDSGPLSIGWDSDFGISKLLFSVQGGNLDLRGAGKSDSLTLQYKEGEHLIRRTYTFYSDSYKVDIQDETSGISPYFITLGSNFGMAPETGERSYMHEGPVLLEGADREEFDDDIKETRSYTGDLKWIAREDKYFASALVPVTEVEEARFWKASDGAMVTFKSSERTNRFVLYAGPKVQEELETIGAELEYIIDYGFFSIISRPIFWLMKRIYSIVGNYGVAIIFLTIIIRVPFIPITNKAQRSMKKLQELQPRMKEIKAKYEKTDKDRMNREMMALYGKNKVNPLGGCLPLLLQIPVFFALYKVLIVSIELRGAPFTLWITDLSAHDPYYVFPIVMGITMFIQQKMTPTAGDPTQQKVMLYAMPGFFTFICFNLSSGLVLYWLVNNLLAIGQQTLILMKKDPPVDGQELEDAQAGIPKAARKKKS